MYDIKKKKKKKMSINIFAYISLQNVFPLHRSAHTHVLSQGRS